MADCFVFDIDGTLADCSHRLHHIVRTDGKPKDWDAFFAGIRDDKWISPVVRVADALRYAGCTLVFVTGRGEEHREATEDWLYARLGINHPLYMRDAGDRRDDDIVKAELLDRVRADGFNPIMAFEDRSRVVKMFRSKGILCAQVAEGDF